MAFHNFLPDAIFKVVLLVWVAVELGLPLHPFLGGGYKNKLFAEHIVQFQVWDEDTSVFEYEELGVMEENCKVIIEPDIKVASLADVLVRDERLTHSIHSVSHS